MHWHALACIGTAIAPRGVWAAAVEDGCLSQASLANQDLTGSCRAMEV
jgi:hypothetical protein